MAVPARSCRTVALAVCCGALAVPAGASANHMGDMPWCPHSNVQGADPADEVPGAGGSGTARAGSEAPIGTAAGASPAPVAQAGPASSPVSTSTSGPATASRPAAVTTAVQQAVGVTAVSTTTTATGAVGVRLATGETVTVRGPVTAEAVRRARARARAQRRLEASARAKARQAARAERARSVRGAQVVAQVRATTPIGWLAGPQAEGARGTALPAIGGALAALLALSGLGAAIVRRRRGPTAPPAVAGGPDPGPTPDRAAAIEAELQEIIAEERAAHAADQRLPALRG